MPKEKDLRNKANPQSIRPTTSVVAREREKYLDHIYVAVFFVHLYFYERTIIGVDRIPSA